MKARRLISQRLRHLEVEEFELGPLPEDGVLVENKFTAISVGTEIYRWVNGEEPGRTARFPRTTGYCNTGTVIEVGSAVRNFQPGDRLTGMGHHASHSIVKGNLHKVPQNVPAQSAALYVLAAVAQHGNRIARIELGESVVILGLGVVGQLALTLARLSGARTVIAVDLDDFRLKHARERGADACINPREVNDVPAAVRDLCIDDGANVVMESTGIPAVYPMAVQMCAQLGRMVSLGSPRGTVEFDFFSDVHLREVQILGAIWPRTPDIDTGYFRWTKDRERALLMELIGKGLLPIDNLVTHIVKPEECQDVYAMLADKPERVLGVLFDWS